MADLILSLLWAAPVIIPCAWIGFKLFQKGEDTNNELMRLFGIFCAFFGPVVVLVIYLVVSK